MLTDPISFNLPDAYVVLYPAFLPADAGTALFHILRNETPWRHDNIRLFGREVMQPRLTAWYGDPGRSYTYSGLTMQPEPWTPALSELRYKLEAVASEELNSVLLNLYRNERDSNGWHSDDERGLGPEPIIVSVSLGATRRFQLRHKSRKECRMNIDLAHGDLLIMRAGTQRYWQHQLPKSSRPCGERINLTFRRIFDSVRSTR